MTRFFFSFFRRTTDLTVYVPLFTDFTCSQVLVSTVFTRFTVNPAVTGSSPCLSQKLLRAIVLALCDSQFFLALCDFFRVFFLFSLDSVSSAWLWGFPIPSSTLFSDKDDCSRPYQFWLVVQNLMVMLILSNLIAFQ